MTQKSSISPTNLFIFCLLILVVLVLNFPIIFMFITSFKEDNLIMLTRPVWIFRPVLEHYRALFTNPIFPFNRFILNSVLAAGGGTALALAISLPAAYSIARFRTGGKSFAFTVLSLRMAPPIVFAIPMYVLMRYYGLIDSVMALIIVYLTFNIPLSVWVLRSFIEDLPAELEETAMVDGCTRWGALFRITVPLLRPGIGAVIILNFIFSWNEFLFAFFLTFDKAVTAPVGTAKFVTGYIILWGNIAAASVIAILPALILGLVMQRQLVRGLTLGAIK